MSLTSWKREFFPPMRSVRKRMAARHSMNKYVGLLSGNLKRHNLKLSDSLLVDAVTGESTGFGLDGSSCALCKHYYHRGCDTCPLVKAGHPACDDSASAYARIVFGSAGSNVDSDILTMIAQLADATAIEAAS